MSNQKAQERLELSGSGVAILENLIVSFFLIPRTKTDSYGGCKGHRRWQGVQGSQEAAEGARVTGGGRGCKGRRRRQGVQIGVQGMHESQEVASRSCKEVHR